MASNRIKALQTSLPRGAPIDSTDLRRLGISAALAHEYVSGGWLERLGRGVFMFTGDTLQRDPCVRFLEKKIPGLHIAAKSALAQHGFRHHLPYSETLILWGDRRAPLPGWFLSRFPSRYSTSQLFDPLPPRERGLIRLTPEGPLVSVPERALLEMLGEAGVHQELAEARAIMESVRSLRSGVMGKLLAACRMTKAVRLCANWASELGLAWAPAAREAAAAKGGRSRWVKRLKDGSTLILKP